MISVAVKKWKGYMQGYVNNLVLGITKLLMKLIQPLLVNDNSSNSFNGICFFKLHCLQVLLLNFLMEDNIFILLVVLNIL